MPTLFTERRTLSDVAEDGSGDPVDDVPRGACGSECGAARTGLSAEIARTAPELMRFALHLTRRDRDKAWDLFADTIVRALQAQERFEPGTNAAAWLTTIMKRMWRDHLLRARSVYRDTDPLIEGHDSPVPPAQDDACQARQIWHALRAVDPDKRRHMLALAMGYTHEEIGTLEGLAPGTIKSSVSRGRRQLRHLLPDFSLDPN